MDIRQAEQLAITLMQEHRLMASQDKPALDYDWSFSWSNSKRLFGTCWHGSRSIELSKPLTELNNESDVRDTILHEIAHALVGSGFGHSRVWKLKAIEVGAKPCACYDSKAITMPKGNYQAVCRGCNKTFPKYRKPRTVRICASCARRYRFKGYPTALLNLEWHEVE